MLLAAAHLASSLPGWLQEPSWLRPFTHAIRIFILHHQSGGLFIVIFLEELGVPLPAPGDAAIAYGGFLTAASAHPTPLAPLSGFPGGGVGTGSNPPLPPAPRGARLSTDGGRPRVCHDTG